MKHDKILKQDNQNMQINWFNLVRHDRKFSKGHYFLFQMFCLEEYF